MPAALPPPNSTALAALPALALDLETTGLNPRTDRIVQIAALAMLGARVLETPRLESSVNPGVPVPWSATRIHGLGDEQLADAPPFAALAPALAGLVAGRVVIGQHIAFDLALLRQEALRAGIEWRDPPALDVGLLFGALDPSAADLSLEELARRLGVTVEGRHSAFGDAMAAAQIYARLLLRLRECDVRTLGEASALAARRAARAAPAAAWTGTPVPPPRIDSYVFERRVEELMSAPAAFIPPSASLREAASLMGKLRIGALLVGEPASPPLGIFTERDLVRVAARDGAESSRVAVCDAMSAPVQGIATGELLYRALARMDHAGFRHLCVLDAAGRALGMLSQRDLLRHRARAANALDVAIHEAQDGTALAAAYTRVPRLADGLLAEGLTAVEIARVISGELRSATARAAQIALDRLGSPPARWCLLVLGSAGRGESLLTADQDNALVHDGTPADDAWFARLGAAVAELLDEAGIPKCKGGVMAANAPWRGTSREWRARIEGWLQRARPEDLLDVDIFFDLVPVAGDPALAQALHGEALAAAAQTPPFLALMAQSVSQIAPSVGAFGGLRTRNGRVDLKRGALLPLVGLARALALRIASSERSTPGRLQAALAAGRIAPADGELLLGLHAKVLELVLRQQLTDLADGVRPSGRVAAAPLGRRGARRLARELRSLRDVLGGLQGAVAG
jgi:DNA polymerase-3 subunit epsilon/CBS domain-containing protein